MLVNDVVLTVFLSFPLPYYVLYHVWFLSGRSFSKLMKVFHAVKCAKCPQFQRSLTGAAFALACECATVTALADEKDLRQNTLKAGNRGRLEQVHTFILCLQRSRQHAFLAMLLLGRKFG